MKRKVLIIGIGAGHPDYVTVQAVKAMNETDVFFIPNKGAEKEELARVRLELIERHVRHRPFRTVAYATPVRDPNDRNYGRVVDAWHDQLEARFGALIADELDESQVGAFLVWGEPTLYDSAMRILDRLRARGTFELDYEVIPGISSVQALAARHRVPLNNIGRSILISNGKTLADGFPESVDSVVLMLNADKALRTADGDLQVYWGANIGLADEVLVAGRLKDVIGDIERIRAEVREAQGWVMDTVLIKRSQD